MYIRYLTVKTIVYSYAKEECLDSQDHLSKYKECIPQEETVPSDGYRA